MFENNKPLQDLFKRAKGYPTKGRLYVYEQFKNELRDMNLNYLEFEQACIRIAKLLRV